MAVVRGTTLAVPIAIAAVSVTARAAVVTVVAVRVPARVAPIMAIVMVVVVPAVALSLRGTGRNRSEGSQCGQGEDEMFHGKSPSFKESFRTCGFQTAIEIGHSHAPCQNGIRPQDPSSGTSIRHSLPNESPPWLAGESKRGQLASM